MAETLLGALTSALAVFSSWAIFAFSFNVAIGNGSASRQRMKKAEWQKTEHIENDRSRQEERDLRDISAEATAKGFVLYDTENLFMPRHKANVELIESTSENIGYQIGSLYDIPAVNKNLKKTLKQGRKLGMGRAETSYGGSRSRLQRMGVETGIGTALRNTVKGRSRS